MPRRLPGFVTNHLGEIAPLMPSSSCAESTLFLTPERVELTVNSNKLKKQVTGNKVGQGSK